MDETQKPLEYVTDYPARVGTVAKNKESRGESLSGFQLIKTA